jgi:class 3 adenylate cyclase
MDSVEEWLQSLRLGELAECFRNNDIDLSVLPHLSDADLEKIGVSLGHRRKILHAIARLDATLHADLDLPPRIDEAAPGAQQQLTVLVCRLADATALANRLDPERMRALTRDVQLTCGSVVRAYNGFLARLLGDGLIAFFGYPDVEEDDADRAVRAALEICAGVEMLESTTAAPVTVQIGIASGTVEVGLSAGAARVRDQTLREPVPELAARLQRLADPGGIVISSATRALVGAGFELRELGYYEVRNLAP